MSKEAWPTKDSVELREQIELIKLALHHDVPESCYSTGPLNSPLEDTRCIACAALGAIDELEAHTAAQVTAAEERGFKKALGLVNLHRDGLAGGPAVTNYEDRYDEVSEIIKDLQAHLTTEQKTEQYQCSSYFDDNGVLQNCKCGKCR